VSLGTPSIVFFLLFLSYSFGVFCLFTIQGDVGRWLAIPFSIFFVLYFLSYIRIITDGPGYFPFYYPMEHFPSGDMNRQLLRSPDDLSPSGIISTDEQHRWAKSRRKPNRCILSTIGRRIVIRPDHFCKWTESWIGKRNQKFFLLFNLYGIIYLLSFLAVNIAKVVDILKCHCFSALILLNLVTLILAMLAVMLNCTFARSHCPALFANRTQWEDWSNIEFDRYRTSYCGNVRDVCGNAWWCWACPVSPWKGMSNAELIAGYTRDYGKVVPDADGDAAGERSGTENQTIGEL
jgi:hypothetical protein